MDFIANRIQLKIAWLSYVVIQSHFLQIKLIRMKGCGERREGYWKYFLFARILSQYIILQEYSDEHFFSWKFLMKYKYTNIFIEQYLLPRKENVSLKYY